MKSRSTATKSSNAQPQTYWHALNKTGRVVLKDWLDTNHLITGAFKRVSHAEKAEVVEQIRAVGNPGFTIWNLDASVRSRRSKNAAKGRAAARNASHEEDVICPSDADTSVDTSDRSVSMSTAKTIQVDGSTMSFQLNTRRLSSSSSTPPPTSITESTMYTFLPAMTRSTASTSTPLPTRISQRFRISSSSDAHTPSLVPVRESDWQIGNQYGRWGSAQSESHSESSEDDDEKDDDVEHDELDEDEDEDEVLKVLDEPPEYQDDQDELVQPQAEEYEKPLQEDHNDSLEEGAPSHNSEIPPQVTAETGEDKRMDKIPRNLNVNPKFDDQAQAQMSDDLEIEIDNFDYDAECGKIRSEGGVNGVGDRCEIGIEQMTPDEPDKSKRTQSPTSVPSSPIVHHHDIKPLCSPATLDQLIEWMDAHSRSLDILLELGTYLKEKSLDYGH